jgi:hypothetical protein
MVTLITVLLPARPQAPAARRRAPGSGYGDGVQMVLAQAAQAAAVSDLLALPWDQPLATWPDELLVRVRDLGLARHVVRFVEAAGTLVALKEMPEELVTREGRLLTYLAEESVPAVELLGTVTERGRDGNGILLTRYLEFSLPYSALFQGHLTKAMTERLVDALAELLVRLHLAGFFWGDCSLANALFRRDAGALSAYLVDAETGELERTLTDGQRAWDLELATERVAGGMADLLAEREAEGWSTGGEPDPIWIAEQLATRYEQLWAELTREEIFDANERHRVEDRIRRLNALGFDVRELVVTTTEGESKLRLSTRVVEPGFHQRELAALTGLDVGENQARRLLNDLSGYRAWLTRKKGKEVPLAVAASRWLAEVYEPTVEAVPPFLRHKLEPAELFHQVLDHRWFLSEASGRDVGTAEAVRSFTQTVLPFMPDERQVLAGDANLGGDADLDADIDLTGDADFAGYWD